MKQKRTETVHTQHINVIKFRFFRMANQILNFSVGAIIKIHIVQTMAYNDSNGKNSNEISFLFHFINKNSVVYMRCSNILLNDFRSYTHTQSVSKIHISQCGIAIISTNFFLLTHMVNDTEKSRTKSDRERKRVIENGESLCNKLIKMSNVCATF